MLNLLIQNKSPKVLADTKAGVETISYKVNKKKLNISFFDNITEAKKWIADF